MLGVLTLIVTLLRGPLEFHSITQSDWPTRKQKPLPHENRFAARVHIHYVLPERSDSQKYVCVRRLIKYCIITVLFFLHLTLTIVTS